LTVALVVHDFRTLKPSQREALNLFNFWIQSAFENARLCQEMHEVMLLRFLKLAKGGHASHVEASRMTGGYCRGRYQFGSRWLGKRSIATLPQPHKSQ